MAKVIMVQGTMSNAGKSIITAGLLRVFAQDGYKVAPFKSQNMALNSFITKDGLEMGRAQVVQAEAAGVEPDVLMNPILLKPNSDTGSQVIVMGKPIGNMKAKEYFKYKKQLIPTIKEAYNKLAEKYDIIVIEGAGSPAEINLKSDDIVNMGMAEMVDAPVILVGDIDRGGVFAQLYGTVELLPYNEKKRIKGIVINKFRGDKAILENGITMLEKKCHTPVVGVVPYGNIDIDDEDSLSTRLENKTVGAIDIAVIRLPKLSNFTDFSPLEQYGMRYVSSVKELGKPDLIVLGGTKNTIADMKWLNETGLTGLLQRIQVPVPRQQQGSAVTDLQIVGSDGHPGSPELIHFIQQILAIKRNAITQNVHNTLTENAGGEQVQSKGPLVIYDRVTGVAAALITDHDVIVIGEIIYHAALALVSPVDSHDGTI